MALAQQQELLTERWDLPHRAGLPARGLVIAGVPGSGVDELCTAIAEVGTCGVPARYLGEPSGPLRERWAPKDSEAYLEMLHARRTSSTGTFSLQLDLDDLDLLRDDELPLNDVVPPGAPWVMVRCEDRFAQAVSLERAAQASLPPGNGTGYDFPSLAGRFADIRAIEDSWRLVLRAQAVVPLVLTCEQLRDNFEWSVRAVLSHAGLPSLRPVVIGAGPSEQDATSELWRTCFERDLASAIAEHEQKNAFGS